MSDLAKVPLTLNSLLLDGAVTWLLSTFCTWALQTHELSEAPIRSVLCNRQGVHEFVLISCDVNTANSSVGLWLRIERHPASQGVGILLNKPRSTMDTLKASTNLQALREPCEACDSFMYNPNENPREKLKFKHIAVMCQYFTGPSVEYSLLGTNCRWICYALIECLRETQPCYGGTWLPSRTERPTIDTRAVQLVKSRYLKDKHPICCGGQSYVNQAFDTTEVQDIIYRVPGPGPSVSSRRELDHKHVVPIPEQTIRSFATLEPLPLHSDIARIPLELPLAAFCVWVLQQPKLTEAPVRQVSCNRQGVHEFVLISCDVIISYTTITLWLRIERTQGVGVLLNKSEPAKDTIKASTNLQALLLKLKHITEMCQYFIRHSTEYSLLGASRRWICYALLECLRDSQPCYGGTWLPSRTERPTADVRAAQLAKSHYLKDKHPTCCGSKYLAYPSFAILAARATTGLASIAAADPASDSNQDNPKPVAIFRPERCHVIGNFGASPDARSLPTDLGLFWDAWSQFNASSCAPPTTKLTTSGPTAPNPQIFNSATERRSYDDPTNAARVQVVHHHSGGCTETPEIEPKLPINRRDVSTNRESSSSEIRDVRTVIHHAMTHSEIAGVLEAHGCENLSKKLDPSTCSEFPLSSGGLGDVYQAKLDGIDIAIKTTRLHLIHKEGEKYLKHAAKEVHTWSKCQHPNVIKLAGFVEFKGQIGMVSKWMGNGNASNFIKRSPEADRCEMCRGICDGLAYLHFIGIIHGDLKGANVLIADNGAPMLSDFGNSVLCDQSLLLTQTTAQGCISARWTAPEILDGSISCSYAADIYALGMTLLTGSSVSQEVITGNPPFCHLSREQAVYHAIAFKKEIPARPESCIPSNSRDGDAFWSLLVDCWEYEPEKRPLAADTQSRVKHITHDGLKDLSADALPNPS